MTIIFTIVLLNPVKKTSFPTILMMLKLLVHRTLDRDDKDLLRGVF